MNRGMMSNRRETPIRQGATPIQSTNKKYLLLRLWGYLSRHKLLILSALVCMLASNLFSLVGPKLSGKAIDAMGIGPGTVDMPTVLYYVMLMAIFYVLSGILSYVLSLIMIRISRKVICRMRKDVFDRLSELPIGFFDKYQTGDIISVISYDIDTVSQSFSNDFLQVVQSIVIVVFSLVMMLSIAPVLVLIFAVTIPLSVFFTKYITTRVRPLFRARSKKLGELNGFVEEMIGGQKTTKAYNREEEVVKRFDVKNREAVDAYSKAEYYGTLTGPSVNFINNLSMVLVSIFGALMYLNGGINLGDISSFVQYSRKFSGPINEIANIIGELQSAFAAAERVFRLIDELPEKEDAPNARVLDNVRGEVDVDRISFGYLPGKTIIHSFSMNVKKGSMIAIVGPTGAGKTTLINLLMRFYDVDSGAIYVDGNSIYDVTRKSLRGAYSMVLQDTWLFYGTIFENIAYGKENATLDDVIHAAKTAKIHDYIESLPNGYDTLLSDNGINISKGQKQLLTIARAMLLDAKMLILDEATSNVDTRTEQQIQAAMRELMRDKTCFIIAHRLSTIRNADNILVLRDGDITEQGTHEELMAKKGFYSKLYYSQFETY